MAVLQQNTQEKQMNLPEINNVEGNAADAINATNQAAQPSPEAVETQAHEQTDKIARRIDNVDVTIAYKNGAEQATDEEIRAYIKRGNQRNPNTVVVAIDLVFDADDVEVHYDLAPVPFDRIRRITGYLVGTMDRWNDAKTSEENDRVKHSVVS